MPAWRMKSRRKKLRWLNFRWAFNAWDWKVSRCSRKFLFRAKCHSRTGQWASRHKCIIRIMGKCTFLGINPPKVTTTTVDYRCSSRKWWEVACSTKAASRALTSTTTSLKALSISTKVTNILKLRFSQATCRQASPKEIVFARFLKRTQKQSIQGLSPKRRWLYKMKPRSSHSKVKWINWK